MKNFIFLSFILLPLCSFSVQYSQSFCQRVGLQDLAGLEGDYRAKYIVPDEKEFKVENDIQASIHRQAKGIYSYVSGNKTLTAFTCKLAGHALFEIAVSYRPEESPDQPAAGFALYQLEQNSQQRTLRIQQVLFNPKVLAQNKIDHKIVSRVRCKNQSDLFAVENCEVMMKSKSLVFNSSNVPAAKLLQIANKASLVINFVKD